MDKPFAGNYYNLRNDPFDPGCSTAMTEFKKQGMIWGLLQKVDLLPYRNKIRLDEFRHEADRTIRDIFGESSDYRHELQRIRFTPGSFYSTEEDYRSSWQQGILNLKKLLNAVLQDPFLGSLPEALREEMDQALDLSPFASQPQTDKEDKTFDRPEPEPPLTSSAHRDESLAETTPEPTPEELELLDEIEIPPQPLNRDEETTFISQAKVEEETQPVQEPESAGDSQQHAKAESSAEEIPLEIPIKKPSELPSADNDIDDEEFDEIADMLLPGYKDVREKDKSGEIAQSKSEESNQEKKETAPIAPSDTGSSWPLPEFQAPPEKSSLAQEIPAAIPPAGRPEDFRLTVRQQVFVVHGYDTLMRDQVVFALQKIGLEPILSDIGHNQGKTLVQKFRDYPYVSFAAVLLSSDDLGRHRDQSPESVRQRARQNVIFQLGFLIGKLGRDRVFVLYPEEKNFEIPTNYFDVLYTPCDKHGRWQFDLLRTLKNCGFTIDANKLV